MDSETWDCQSFDLSCSHTGVKSNYAPSIPLQLSLLAALSTLLVTIAVSPLSQLLHVTQIACNDSCGLWLSIYLCFKVTIAAVKVWDQDSSCNHYSYHYLQHSPHYL